MKTQELKPPIFRKRPQAFYASARRRVGGVLVAAAVLGFAAEPEARAQAAGGAAAAPRDNSPVGIASREATRRLDTVKAAQDLLTAAEYDRSENRNKEALEKLGTAFLAVANVPAAYETREAIFNRYQKAALAYAKELVDQALWEDAEKVLTDALATARDAGKLPAQVDTGIRTLLQQVKGSHFNKSLTPKHLDNITLVERNLKEANVLIGAGDFDGARKRYHLVLNLDRYNAAARRGLEKLEQFVMEYHRVAYSQTRAAQMRAVAEGWDLQPPPVSSADLDNMTVLQSAGTGQAALQEKLRRIVLPQIEFQDTPVRTVIEYLTQKAEELDTATADPTKRGLNIVIDTGGGPAVDDLPVTVRLSNAPLADVLNYVTQKIGMKYRVDEFAISIVPLTAPDATRLITATYDVPPGFLSMDQGGGAAAGVAPDPFANPAAPGAGGGTIVKRLSAQAFLEQQGVTFPPGAIAQMSGNSRMIVRNNADNLELIESLILGARESGSKLVMVEFKMISIAEDTLKEIGFDWLVGPFNMGDGGVFGSGGTFGNQSTNKTQPDFPFGAIGGGIVTGGLRTGDTSTTQSIEDVINRDAVSEGVSTAAPAVFGVSGPFTDPQFEFVWRALNQRKGLDRLCSASVVTRPGERAVIRQVREFIYPTEYDPPQIPNSVGVQVAGNIALDVGLSGIYPTTPATPTAFEMRELGKIMEVEPVIGADGITVNLNISIDMSDFVGFVNYGSPITQVQNSQQLFGIPVPGLPGFFFLFLGQGPGAPVVITENRILMPVFDAVKQTTNVSIFDGQTVAIGGLMGEQIDKVQDKVPLLGDAPGIGRLFRSDIAEHKKRAVVLFARVRIQDAAGRPFNDQSQFAGRAAAGGAN